MISIYLSISISNFRYIHIDICKYIKYILDIYLYKTVKVTPLFYRKDAGEVGDEGANSEDESREAVRDGTELPVI
jgi:hypothetical protein